MAKVLETSSTIYRPWQLPRIDGEVIDDRPSAQSEPMTAARMEELHQQAYDEGFALGKKEGIPKGYLEGKETARAELEQKGQALAKLFDVLAVPLQQLDQETERSMVDLSILIAKHLVRRELKADPGEVVGVVREATKHLPIAARRPRIHLNPEDLELVRDAMSIGKEDKESWQLEADPLVTRGGCLVETEISTIDATVEARLSAIVSKLLGGERESDRVES